MENISIQASIKLEWHYMVIILMDQIIQKVCYCSVDIKRMQWKLIKLKSWENKVKKVITIVYSDSWNLIFVSIWGFSIIFRFIWVDKESKMNNKYFENCKCQYNSPKVVLMINMKIKQLKPIICSDIRGILGNIIFWKVYSLAIFVF